MRQGRIPLHPQPALYETNSPQKQLDIHKAAYNYNIQKFYSKVFGTFSKIKQEILILIPYILFSRTFLLSYMSWNFADGLISLLFISIIWIIYERRLHLFIHNFKYYFKHPIIVWHFYRTCWKRSNTFCLHNILYPVIERRRLFRRYLFSWFLP